MREAGDEGPAASSGTSTADGARAVRPSASVAIFRIGLGGLAAIFVVGLSGPPVLLAVRLVLLGAGLATAVLWGRGRLSTVWALVGAWAVMVATILVNSAGPGGWSFMGLLFDGAAVLVLILASLALVVSRLVAEGDGSSWPLLIVAVLGVACFLALRVDLPTQARFAVSRPALDGLLTDVSSTPNRSPASTPSSLGAYEVQWVEVRPDGSVVVAIAGDCGWFAQCTLQHSARPASSGTDLGGGWYAVTSRY